MMMDKIRIKPAWSKSKVDIWNEVFDHLDEHGDNAFENLAELRHKKVLWRRIPVWGYVASLLIPVLLICHFYTVTTETSRGEHLAVRLPDRSIVTLNAESKLSYKPLAWFVVRKATLQGEACFDVKPGSSFHVQSGRNRVTVLGTTFNVFTRVEKYCVTCLSGQVEVQLEAIRAGAERAGKETVILNPNMQVVSDTRQFRVSSDVTATAVTGWMQGMFVFVETPLQEVIAEVERQYNITVTPDRYPNHVYSGNFSKTDNTPEEVLEIIGKPFDIPFRIQ